MKNLLFSLNLLFTLVIFGQNQANNWYFGQNAGLNFSSGNPVALTDGALNTPEGCSTISDSTGNLLFYTDGIDVWNKNHNLMPNGSGLLGASSSTQSGIIVPHPGDNNLYYVFSLAEIAGPNGLRYSLVDMSLDSGLGDVVVAQKNVLLYTPTSEKISAIKHSNGNDIWVVTHEGNSNKFVSYLVTNSGIIMIPVVTELGHSPIDVYDNIGAMKISPDGTKIAVVYSSEVLELFEFNTTTGKLSNNIQITDFNQGLSLSYIYGVEFSSNSKYLYVSESQDGIIQFDVSSFNYNDILNSRYDIATNGMSFGDLPHSALQLGPDKKIYVAHFNNEYLGVINNPNSPGNQVDYQYNGVFLEGGISKAGLPPFIQSFFYSYIEVADSCLGDSTAFSINGSQNFDSVLWDLGDGTISTQQSLDHLYSASGTYQVELTIVDGTDIITQTKEVTVHDLPEANIPTDIILCSNVLGDPLDLTSQNQLILGNQSNLEFDITYHLSYQDAEDGLNAILSPFQTEQSETTIYARLFNLNNSKCNSITQFQIKYENSPEFELYENWYLCEGQNVTISLSNNFDSYLWSTGEVSNSITLEATGEYWVEVSNIYGNLICTETKFFNVIISQVAQINSVEISDWTNNDNTISIEVEGLGDYLYSIDGINYQESNLFSNVKHGDLTVYVKDKYNCGTVTKDVFLLYYPRFFTPNGDGFNDNWLIKSLETESDYTIDIFDRYGVLIKQLNSQDNFWDGTFNGFKMNSDDYWFVLTLLNGNVYRGHFALKR